VPDRTVLVVEDFDDTRAFIRMLLEMRGCQVLEAVNGSTEASRIINNAATRGGAQTELDWIESEKSWVLDCYGGILPIK
jgi:CheY-like chemotaxis protein